MKIIVGNLNAMTTASDLCRLFFQFGKVMSIKLMRELYNGRFTCYALIRMERMSGNAAIQNLDSRKFLDRYMHVSEAPY